MEVVGLKLRDERWVQELEVTMKEGVGDMANQGRRRRRRDG